LSEDIVQRVVIGFNVFHAGIANWEILVLKTGSCWYKYGSVVSNIDTSIAKYISTVEMKRRQRRVVCRKDNLKDKHGIAGYV